MRHLILIGTLILALLSGCASPDVPVTEDGMVLPDPTPEEKVIILD